MIEKKEKTLKQSIIKQPCSEGGVKEVEAKGNRKN